MHIAVIPDGNRRYMLKYGIGSLERAYRSGISKIYDFIEWCIELGVKEVTIYVLSLENLINRSKKEIELLMKLFSEEAKKSLKDDRIHKNEIRVKICGDKNFIKNLDMRNAKDAIENLEKLEAFTCGYERLLLNLAIAYGGRQEIMNVIAALRSHKSSEINEMIVKQYLWVNSYPDIIIRTSERRLSNFLLWQSAYSEIYFIDKLWPEFEKKDLIEIINDYNSRERRFGR